MQRKRKALYLLLSVVLSIVLIYLLLKQVSAAELVSALKNLYYPSVFLYILLALSGAGLRAWRYRLLLQPQEISWPRILMVTFIKNSLIDLLPARIGSLSYIYLLNRRLGIPFEPVTSSFVAAFLLDFITLSPFLLISIGVVGLGVDPVASPVVMAVALAFLLLVLGLYTWVGLAARLVFRVYQSIGYRLTRGQKLWFVHSLEKFKQTILALEQTRRHRATWLIFVLSFLVRLAKYGSLFFLLHSLLRSYGFNLNQLSFWRLILGTSGAELTSAMPVKGIAGFGTWESAWALTFRLMGSEPRLAIISGLGVHFITNLFEYSLGIGSLFLLALPRFRKNENPRRG